MMIANQRKLPPEFDWFYRLIENENKTTEINSPGMSCIDMKNEQLTICSLHIFNNSF